AVFPMLQVGLEGDLFDRIIRNAGGRDSPLGCGVADESRRNLLVRVEILMPAEEDERPQPLRAVPAKDIIRCLDIKALHRGPDCPPDKDAHSVRSIQGTAGIGAAEVESGATLPRVAPEKGHGYLPEPRGPLVGAAVIGRAGQLEPGGRCDLDAADAGEIV